MRTDSKPKQREQVAAQSGGHLARMLETLNGFKDKYGHWPTKLRLPTAALELLRNKHLTEAAFQAVESKLELVAGEHEALVAEDEAGLKFDYAKDRWLGKPPAQVADQWLWQVKL